MDDIKVFSGIMNTDDSEDVFPQGHHGLAYNLRFRGTGGNLRAENLKGTTEILFTKPSGINQKIGEHYDTKKKRIIWFNFNSNDTHGIYSYSTTTGTVSPIVINGTNTAGDILGFEIAKHITSINIIHADEDMLYYVDSKGRPTVINIDKAINGGYGTIKRAYIDVAKAPFSTPPLVEYQSDADATAPVSVNNLKNALFQFCYRPIYLNYEKPVWSSGSKVPLTIIPTVLVTDNARIAVTIETGDADVKQLEIAVRQFTDTGVSDWLKAIRLDKAELGIADNSTYTYRFYNDSVYTAIPSEGDTKLQVLELQDYAPREAAAQEVLNGNVLIYGGIKEGFDKVVADTSILIERQIETADPPKFAFSPDSRQSFGIEYFDDKGRTNGVTYPKNWDISTLPYNYAGAFAFSQIPKLTFGINHRPPLWAKYFHIVRTNTETYEKKLYWVTTNVFSDDSGISDVAGTRYAYLDINNINLYSESISRVSGNTFGYEFQRGDRIKIMGRFEANNTLTRFDTAFDYEIVGTSNSQNINGKLQKGYFVKIVYPATDINADLKFDGTAAFSSYYILIYSYKKHSQNQNATYFECGYKFDIGNAGTNLAYHKGNAHDQTPNLATAAAITITDGDFFYRKRDVPKGGGKFTSDDLYFEDISGQNRFDYATIPFVTQDAPVTVPLGVISNQGAIFASPLNGVFPLSSSINPYFQNTSGVSVRVHIKFDFDLDSDDDMHVNFFTKTVNTPTPFAPTILKDLNSPVLVLENAGVVKGQVDNYVDVPAGAKMFLLIRKTILSKVKINFSNISIEIINTVTINIFEDTYSDTYPIKANSNSRATVIDEDAKEKWINYIRWSLAYQSDTNVNQTNRFLPANYDDLDKGKGDIKRMKVRANILRIFQTRGTAQHGVYTTFIHDAAGNQTLTTTNNIITARNAKYYLGEFGMGDIETNLISSPIADYYIDPVTGHQIRLSGDGNTSISENYKGQFFLSSKFTPYNKVWNRADGAVAKILGCFDTKEGECITVLQGGTNESESIEDFAFSFNEKRNAYCTALDYKVEGIICAEDMLYSWANNGSFYVHNNTTARNNFHGTQYKSSIWLYFNKPEVEKKSWMSITQNANQVWAAPVIYTQTESYGGQRQESNLVASDFEYFESAYSAALLKDKNSVGGIVNGDDLKGTFIAIKLESTNSDKFVFLAKVTVKFIDSPRTV